MDQELKPEARAMRLLLIPPAVAAGGLWAVRDLVPQPWMVIDFLCKDLWGMARQVRYADYQFYFNGQWVTPGWRWFPPAIPYISHSWKASTAVAVALLIGGIVAVIVDRLAIRWNTPSK